MASKTVEEIKTDLRKKIKEVNGDLKALKGALKALDKGK
jgi:hypothetical protein